MLGHMCEVVQTGLLPSSAGTSTNDIYAASEPHKHCQGTTIIPGVSQLLSVTALPWVIEWFCHRLGLPITVAMSDAPAKLFWYSVEPLEICTSLNFKRHVILIFGIQPCHWSDSIRQHLISANASVAFHPCAASPLSLHKEGIGGLHRRGAPIQKCRLGRFSQPQKRAYPDLHNEALPILFLDHVTSHGLCELSPDGACGADLESWQIFQ